MTRLLFAMTAALAVAACSGNFETGTGMPNTLPQTGEPTPPVYGQGGIAQNLTPTPSPSGSPDEGTQTYAVAAAPDGLQCPATLDSYGCTLRFNIPTATPTPTPDAGAKITPTPSPTPTASQAPESGIADVPQSGMAPASPTPSPTPSGPTVTLKAAAMPKNAPAMYHTPANTLDVVPLMIVQFSPSADFALNGPASAQFTLPKEQTAQRGFAVQLFQATTHKKHTDYKPIWTFDKSTLADATLTFAFTPPKMTIAKNSTYVLVLYGDDKSKVSPVPSGSPGGLPTASASTPVPSST